jgi:hypothetical protein
MPIGRYKDVVCDDVVDSESKGISLRKGTMSTDENWCLKKDASGSDHFPKLQLL